LKQPSETLLADWDGFPQLCEQFLIPTESVAYNGVVEGGTFPTRISYPWSRFCHSTREGFVSAMRIAELCKGVGVALLGTSEDSTGLVQLTWLEQLHENAPQVGVFLQIRSEFPLYVPNKRGV
jgi:hypothetical protein